MNQAAPSPPPRGEGQPVARMVRLFFWAYGALTAYVYLRLFAGLPFQRWTFFLHPVLAFAFAFTLAVQREGWPRALRFLFLTTLGTLAVESVGVATGAIFGPYHYTEKLGALFLGRVPYVIPIVWFYMLYPSHVIAGRILGEEARPLARAAVSGLLMVSWDLVLDPVMVGRGHWVWERSGAYFGIPLQNFFGWWLTTFLIVGLYLWRRRNAPPARTGLDRLAAGGYAIMGYGSVLSAIHAGLWGPALFGALAMGFWLTLMAVRGREKP